MHRVDGGIPQWEQIPSELWNEYQIRAAETNGWDTPGNRETLKGAIATFVGLGLLYADTPLTDVLGTAAVGWGRWKDVKDGRRSAETGTMSPLGEKLDASIDNVLMAAAIPVLVKRRLLTPAEGLTSGTLVAAKSIATITAKYLRREIHASRAGKYGAFLQWGGIGMLCVSRIANNLESESLAETSITTGRILIGGGKALSLVAVAGYAKDALAL